MDLDACIKRIFDNIEDRNREEAESAMEDAREWIRKGGSMDCKQYDMLRKAHACIKGLLVDETEELQPTELIPTGKP